VVCQRVLCRLLKIVILSEAKDLLSPAPTKQPILCFAHDKGSAAEVKRHRAIAIERTKMLPIQQRERDLP
jgi:hypothetical protein